MNRWIWVLAVFHFSAHAAESAPALETAQEKAEAILAKAIHAYGGEKKLTQLRAVTFQYSGEQESVLITGKITLNLVDTGDYSNRSDFCGHSLVSLKAKGCKMAPLGESKVGDCRVVGIKIIPQDGPELRLYFDRENSLLLKREERTSLQPSGEDLVEFLYEDYSGDDYKYPAKITTLRNGMKVGEAEITEFSPAEEVKQPDSEGETKKDK